MPIRRAEFRGEGIRELDTTAPGASILRAPIFCSLVNNY